MIPEPGVVEVLRRLIAGGPFDASGNGFPEPWRGIIGRLATLDVTKRPATLRQELQQVIGSDSDRLLDTILGSNEDGGSAGGVLKAALEYHGRGWSVVPVKPGTKRPACRWLDFQHNRASEEQLRSWFDPAQGEHFEDIAVVLGDISGRLAVRDFDEAGAYQRWAEDHREYAGLLPTVKTARGWHVYLCLPEDSSIKGTVNLGDGELRTDGGIVLVPPSRHPSGATYQWIIPLPQGKLLEIDPVEIGLADGHPSPPSRPVSGVIPEGQRNAALTSMAGSMRRGGASENTIRTALLSENSARCNPPLSEDEVDSIAGSIARYEPANPTTEIDHFTELGNTRRLVRRHGADIRYVTRWNKWIIWDGTRWQIDASGGIIRLAKDTIGELLREAAELEGEDRQHLVKWALKSETDRQFKAMIKLAESEPEIPISPDQLDSDPWLLNCMNGTLSLKTSELYDPRREDLITHVAPVQYDPDAPCPQWDKFLQTITGEDEGIIEFLRRAVGYSLTGDVSEQALFILHGTGLNGKSTFLETIRSVLGEYARHTPTETLMVKRNSGIPNDLARLFGARMVTAVESEDGRRLAESLIKQLTGGDAISARFLHQEFFDFHPTFKLFLATNHRPQIRGTDHAIWRRIRLIPFTVTIPNDQQDKMLLAKLQKEASGILRWAAEGCQAWLQHGLGEPPAVVSAIESYREEMDTIGKFLADRCICHNTVRVGSSELYQAYKEWCGAEHEDPLTHTKFSLRLKDRGFQNKKSGAKTWLGIGLISDRNTKEDHE